MARAMASVRPSALLALPFVLAFAGGAVVVVACGGAETNAGTDAPVAPPTPEEDSGTPVKPVQDAAVVTAPTEPDPLAACTKDPGATPPVFDPASPTDPIGGADKFTLAMALAGFPDAPGKLTARIRTEKNSIVCTFDDVAAPISVANFIGLARGTRPYKITAKWQVGRFFDGLVFHRVIPDFVIQGGDPDGVGTGGPGYDLVKENQVAEPLGTLAMAASKKVSGSQFYVVVGQGPQPNYNVFGTCTTDVAIAIAAVPRDEADMPKNPVHMLSVDIARCP
jgi:peptidyl-prolyl cis-trans isomerase A (cyclophilin A)